MIAITGAAGFIASNVAALLNRCGRSDLVIVDNFSVDAKRCNWEPLRYALKVDRREFPQWLDSHHGEVEALVHLGARTDTTEFDWNVFEELNLGYTKQMWTICARHAIPMVYASSAATYGDGSLGYSDSLDMVGRLQPLNPYGRSKNEFDKWAIAQRASGVEPPFWAGLKFFNVYGPNEMHKGRMASVVLHTYQSVMARGYMELFRSHRPDYRDGGQLRDFVYVEDVAEVILFMLQHKPESGLYNVGTGRAETFEELASATFAAMQRPCDIRYIDIPVDIRDKYQYYTQADITRLRQAGYDKPFKTLRQAVPLYVQQLKELHSV
ncbi:MAG: ADP-glyceromanno-heptose 6-epimerase [Bacteroidales bacterium]|nr:ADP-glyceromanno-heptose 6-epimerase [Bacteroidales bacterium]